MEPGPYLDRILDDESLAGDLDESEAAALVKAIVARAETAVRSAKTEAEADAVVTRLRAAGQGIGKVVVAWRDDGPQAAGDLAKKHGLPAPPPGAKKPTDVLTFLLNAIN